MATLRQEVDREHGKYLEAFHTNAELRDELNRERLSRVSAQRGLVAYMQRHDLGHRIGYDPDKDQAVVAEIAAGRIPPPEDHA